MKALTVKQPWASMIVQGIKDVENRTWPTKFRGRLLIHAASESWNIHQLLRYMTEAMMPVFKTFGLSSVLLAKWLDGLPRGCIIGSVEVVDCVINYSSIWAESTKDHEVAWNWILTDPVLFKEPIPAKGTLSLWVYTGNIEYKQITKEEEL